MPCIIGEIEGYHQQEAEERCVLSINLLPCIITLKVQEIVVQFEVGVNIKPLVLYYSS